MKKIVLIILCNLIAFYVVIAQEEKMEIEGAIQIADYEDPTPDEGTIRYNAENQDFEGWNGLFWASFTGYNYTTSTVTDIDGNVYGTVEIGDQEWMYENLKTTTFNDGTPIDLVTSNTLWSGLSVGAYCYYDNDISYSNEYGNLYNWYTVQNNNLCPAGWTVPSNQDWINLRNELGGTTAAGFAIKESGTEHWIAPNAGATNTSGFSAYGGGTRLADGSFTNFNVYGYWWASTPSGNINYAYRVYVGANQEAFSTNTTENRKLGFSIRCVKQ